MIRRLEGAVEEEAGKGGTETDTHREKSKSQ